MNEIKIQRNHFAAFRVGIPEQTCQSIFDKNPNAKSGAYWLMVNGVKFKVCPFQSSPFKCHSLIMHTYGLLYVALQGSS